MMRPQSLFSLGLLVALAAGCTHRSVIASQREDPPVCGPTYFGRALFLNGRVLWSTESEAEWREWLSRIDPADVETMSELSRPAAAALFGTRGADGAVEVTLKRGSASEKRFSTPPPPRPNRSYCHVPRLSPAAAPPSPALNPDATERTSIDPLGRLESRSDLTSIARI